MLSLVWILNSPESWRDLKRKTPPSLTQENNNFIKELFASKAWGIEFSTWNNSLQAGNLHTDQNKSTSKVDMSCFFVAFSLQPFCSPCHVQDDCDWFKEVKTSQGIFPLKVEGLSETASLQMWYFPTNVLNESPEGGHCIRSTGNQFLEKDASSNQSDSW